MSMGQIIATARQRKKLSQRDLAELTGIHSSHISEMETGKRGNPSFRNVVKIANALGLKLNRLAQSL